MRLCQYNDNATGKTYKREDKQASRQHESTSHRERNAYLIESEAKATCTNGRRK